MSPQEYIAKIFRTSPEIILDMEKKMATITGKKDILDNLVKENEHRISRTLSLLGCHEYKAEKVRQSLLKRIKDDDWALYNLFKKPSGTSTEGLKTLFNFALELVNIGPLFVLKREKAEEIIRKNPPPNIMKSLGYKDADKLLKEENLFEIFAALRFVETNDWMHEAFDKVYDNLTPKDFEKRAVDLRALSGKWLDIAEKFVKKKYHNVSHLKELGVVFIIPLTITTPGETLRLFSMILHYLHELKFYSDLFERAANLSDFGKRLISLLKGSEPGIEVFEKNKMNWLIIQQYLAKDNDKDSRLFVPHINSEALHWRKAEHDLSNFGKRFPNIDLELWLELDWVGGFFKRKRDGISKEDEELVSFDLIDNWMALVNKEQRIKYLYHHQEALWNKIFEEYMGSENLERMMANNFDKGFINIKFECQKIDLFGSKGKI